jgi:hypothetical protein
MLVVTRTRAPHLPHSKRPCSKAMPSRGMRPLSPGEKPRLRVSLCWLR